MRLSTNDFSNIGAGRDASLFRRVEMNTCIDVSTAMDAIRQTHSNNVDIVGDGSKYYEFMLMVKSAHNKEYREEKFWFDYTPLNYGGWRYWLKCLDCKRRVTKLYITVNRVACRKCLDLVYTSQTGNKNSIRIRVNKYFKAIELRSQRRRMTYAGKPTRYGRRFKRYYGDPSSILAYYEELDKKIDSSALLSR